MVFFVSLAVDFLANTRGIPPLENTAVLVLFNGSSALLSVFVGRWADRSGRAGALISLGMGLLAAGLLGFYLALVYAAGAALLAAVVGSATLAGFGSAFYHPLGGTILQASYDEASRGRALGANGSIGSVGRALDPSLFYVVPLVATIYDPFAVFALVGFAVAALLWFGLHGWRGPSGEEPPRPLDANGGARSVRVALTKGALLLTSVVFIRSLATQGIVSWLPTYITSAKGAGLGAALGGVVTAMYVPAIFGQPVFGWLVDHYDRRLVLGLSSAAAGLSILGYLATNDWTSVVYLALFGLFTFSGFPLFLSLAADYVPRDAASMGNALVWGVGASGGSVFGPLVAGAIIATDYSLLGLAFEVLAGVAILSAIGTLLLPRGSRDPTPPRPG